MVGHQEIKLILTRMVLLESAMLAAARKSHKQSCPAVNPVNYNNDCCGRICQWVQQWQGCYECNQPLSGCL